MIPIEQTKFGASGNCFDAALASILEISLDEIPDFGFDATWLEKAKEFVGKFGFDFVVLHAPRRGFERYPLCDDVIHIASGPVHGARYHHAVVYQGNKLLHDPGALPGIQGIRSVKRIFLLIPTDPAKAKRIKP